MSKRYFTIIELLVAVGVMMILSSAIAYTYSSTAQLASGQMSTAELSARAGYLLDSIGENLKALRSHDVVRIPEKDRMVGKYLNSDGQALTADEGTPYLAFVNSEHRSKTLKETAYYTIFNKNTGYYDAFRMSQKLGVGNSLLEDAQNDLFTEENLADAKIAENVIYLKFAYWNGGNNVDDTHKSTTGPITVDVTLSMAAGTGPSQWSGRLDDDVTDTKCVVIKESGTFPFADENGTAAEGYILIGDGIEGNVFKYMEVSVDGDKYTFTGGKVEGLAVLEGNEGDEVIIGQTFKRSYVLK